MSGLLILLFPFWLYKNIDGQLWYNGCRDNFMHQFNVEEQSSFSIMQIFFLTKP